jgi:molybdate transport system substrate-binding protein
MRFGISIVAAAIASLAVSGAVSAQAALKVLASNGMKAVIDDLRPELERAAGKPLAIQFGTTASMRQRIDGGEAFDVVVLTVEAIDALAKGGKVAPGSVGALGRGGVGVGVRAGAAKPDVSTPDAFKRALLATKSVTWVGVGASRPFIEGALSTLGIAEQMKPKIVLAQSVDESVENVAAGKVEMVLTLTSEILPAHGVEHVGPLPGNLQGYVSFAAGVGAASSLRAEGAKLVAALHAPSAAGIYQKRGMEIAAAAR